MLVLCCELLRPMIRVAIELELWIGIAVVAGRIDHVDDPRRSSAAGGGTTAPMRVAVMVALLAAARDGMLNSTLCIWVLLYG